MSSEDNLPNLKEKKRTLGDGMDNSLINLTENVIKHNLKINIPTTSSSKLLSFKPVEPQTKIYNLIPKYVPKARNKPKYLIRKPKEPKFIPYEPYKGAIEPIIPHKVKKTKIIADNANPSKNNIEIQKLVTQMSEMRMAEMSKIEEEAGINEEQLISIKQWENEKVAYETDIKNLRETNAHLENQLKFQAQVNSELKTLLVAAVGEDLESRVQHLTEDKLQLARALLKSANHLTSHQEQTEWLSGQCEVWRSKFLASSLMVEELARWKSALTNRISELQESVKYLLDDYKKIKKISLKSNCYLNKIVLSSYGEKNVTINKNSNIIDLCNNNLSLIEEIGNNLNSSTEISVEDCSKQIQTTMAEKMLLKLLQNPVTITNKQDAICKALMGAALSLTGEQMYLQNPSSHSACCAHCTGEIEDV